MSTTLSLYQIEQELAALIDTESMVDSPEQRMAILADIGQAHEAALAKRDRVIAFLRTLEHRIEEADKEIDRISRLRDSWKLGKKRVESYICRVIEEFAPESRRGPKKLEGRFGVLSLAKNPDSVEILDGSLVPLEFKDVTIRLSGEEYSTLLSRLESAGLLEEGVLLASRSQSAARKADIKRAFSQGQEVQGADLRYGDSRLVLR